MSQIKIFVQGVLWKKTRVKYVAEEWIQQTLNAAPQLKRKHFRVMKDGKRASIKLSFTRKEWDPDYRKHIPACDVKLVFK